MSTSKKSQETNTLPADLEDAGLWNRLAGKPGQDFRVSIMHRLRLSGSAPDSFTLHMRPVIPMNRQRGARMMRGLWQIGMDRLESDPDTSPWRMVLPNRHYADRLHRFDWLVDLFSQGEAGSSLARHLVDDWISQFGHFEKFTWRPDCTGERVWNWLQCGPELFERGNTNAFQGRLHALDLQIRHVMACSGHGAINPGLHWRTATLGVAQALCFARNTELEHALTRLEKACQKQFLPDGGHVSRSPAIALYALADLIMLQDLLSRSDRNIPDFIIDAIDQIGNMVGFFCAGDGGLMPFHDGGELSPETVRAVLQHVKAPRRFDIAVKSGFHKLHKQDSQLIIDVRQAPEPPFANHAHAGTLGFELHDGPARIITSCGFSPDIDIALREAVRRTSAHTTLVLEDTNSARFLVDQGTRLLYPKGPEDLSVKRLEETGQGIWLDTGHGGYKRDFGLYHRRRLFMPTNGERLIGEDSLAASRKTSGHDQQQTAYTIRFHIHPDTIPHVTDTAIILKNKHGAAWRFITNHDNTHLDETLYLGRGIIERSQQIVLSGKANNHGDGTKPPNCIRWAFIKTDTV